MQQVRTRMQPGVVIDVPDDEYEVLVAGGLLADDHTTMAHPAEQPAAETPEPATDAPTAAADTTKKRSG